MTELPDMQFLARLGVVQFPPAPMNGFTRRGTPLRNRCSRLTSTQYTRLRLARLYAAGLTARGTPRKNRRGRLSRAEYSRLYRERLWAQGLTSKGTAPKTKRKN